MHETTEHFFDLNQLSGTFPSGTETMLEDLRLVDENHASCRLVRMYSELPLHYHEKSDENVYVFSGRAIFQLEDERRELSVGMFVQFRRRTRHAVLKILEHPFITLTVDTPRRPETDVTFV